MTDENMQTIRFRPSTLDDIQRLGELIDIESMALRGIRTANLDELRTEMTTEGFSLADDTLVATDAAGLMMAYADLWCVEAPHVKQYTMPLVHPDWQDVPGLTERLMAFVLKRAEDMIPLAPPQAKVTLGMWVDELNVWAITLADRYGFSHVRDFARMRIDLDTMPAAPVLPDGLRIRTWELGVDDRALWEAKNEAFMDHWGHVEGNHDEDFARWMKYRQENPHFKPETNYMVMDGDEIAAVCLCEDYMTESDEMAYVGTVGVRRQWRKKGLASALLTHSFREMAARGKKSVVLYVDTDSLTDAYRLYEKVGMYREQVHRVYERVLREGEDLVTHQLS